MKRASAAERIRELFCELNLEFEHNRRRPTKGVYIVSASTFEKIYRLAAPARKGRKR